MSATDELRRMLDERGVEWGNVRNDGYESDYLTEWQINGIQGHAFVTVTEWPGGLSLETHQHYLTPEQAISATLGAGTCEVEGYDDGMDEGMDGDWYSYAPPTWYLSCGHRCDGSERPSFCPMCGRKVVHGDS